MKDAQCYLSGDRYGVGKEREPRFASFSKNGRRIMTHNCTVIIAWATGRCCTRTNREPAGLKYWKHVFPTMQWICSVDITYELDKVCVLPLHKWARRRGNQDFSLHAWSQSAHSKSTCFPIHMKWWSQTSGALETIYVLDMCNWYLCD